jgi:hypothetical protein
MAFLNVFPKLLLRKLAFIWRLGWSNVMDRPNICGNIGIVTLGGRQTYDFAACRMSVEALGHVGGR